MDMQPQVNTCFNTLNIEQASLFLGAHKETVRRMAARGELPGAKVGRKWTFIEQDLVEYLRNKYSSSDASQGVHDRSNKQWHSQRKTVTGGLISPTVESEYVKVLKLR